MADNKWKDWQQFFNEEGASDVQLVGDYYSTEMINMEELYQIFKARLQAEILLEQEDGRMTSLNSEQLRELLDDPNAVSTRKPWEYFSDA